MARVELKKRIAKGGDVSRMLKKAEPDATIIINLFQQTQNIWLTFIQRRPNVFDAGPCINVIQMFCLLDNVSENILNLNCGVSIPRVELGVKYRCFDNSEQCLRHLAFRKGNQETPSLWIRHCKGSPESTTVVVVTDNNAVVLVCQPSVHSPDCYRRTRPSQQLHTTKTFPSHFSGPERPKLWKKILRFYQINFQ